MPLYEYVCPSCKASREKLEPYDSAPPLCHSCLETTMERQFSTGTRFSFAAKRLGEWGDANE